MTPPSLDFRRLKERVSVELVLAHRGLLDGLRLRGHCLVGPCPVHGGDNPRAFVVDRHRNLWRCFTGCDAGGDVVELVRRLDGLTYAQAACHLASLAALRLPLPPPPPLPPQRPFRPFTACLKLDPEAPLLRQKGIRPATAQDFEVGAWHGGGMLRGCVALRLREPTGWPLGYAGRRTDPEAVRHRGKWVFPPRLPKAELLYGLFQSYEHLRRTLVLVECPWAVLRLHQLRIPAVALLGTHLSPAQQHLLARTSRLVVMMDGDHAGQNAAQRIRGQLEAHSAVTLAQLPHGADPDDLTDFHLAQLLHPLLPS